MPEPTTKVFISHADEDKPKIVVPLAKALERRGVPVWLDSDELRASESITGEIAKGINECSHFVAVLTPDFMRSNFARRELEDAISQDASTGRRRIIPVLFGTEDERREVFKQFLLGDTKGLLWTGDADAVAQEIWRLVNPGTRAVSRVCFISSEYPPRVAGGLGVHVDQLTKALAEHVEVDLVLSSPGREGYRQPPARVNLHTLTDVRPTYDDPVSWLRFANLAADRVTRVLASDNRLDVIHCHDWVTVLAGIKCSRRLGVPLVFHLHLPNRAALCASVENLGLVSADLVTVSSEFMRVQLQNRRLPPLEVEVIKNGVDTEAFAPSKHWPEEGGYVLFVGRLVQQKGVEHLLRAFYCVKERFPDVGLKIVGRGELKPALTALCGNLMLDDQVEFIDWTTGPQLAELYQRARVVVVPSIYEPFGMTAIEAMACQRPVVASFTGGLQDIVKHGKTGFHAMPEDDLGLAQWIMALLGRPELGRSMGEAGCAEVLSGGYTWPQVAQDFIQKYEWLRGRTVVKSRTAESFEFEKQIREAALASKPPLDRNELDELFRWEA